VTVRGLRRIDALAARAPARRRWRIRVAVLVSVLIHALIGVVLLVTIRHEPKEEMLPPPSAVTMVFDGGRKAGPTLPSPSLPMPPPAPPLAPPPVPTAEPPQPVAPPVRQPAQPVAPPPPEAVEPETAPPPPPPPPPMEAEPAPQPRPPQPKQALVTKPPPAPKPPAPPKPSDFPAPMNFSFGPTGPKVPVQPAPAQHAAKAHFPGTIDMSMGPASPGEANATPFGDREDAAVADWRNALSRWVSEHAYYPPQAIRDLQEGDAKVHVTVLPNGKVKQVELIGRSGSVWLDMGLVALFRDQHIPPLPSGETDPVEFNFTMHYILQIMQSGGGGGMRFGR